MDFNRRKFLSLPLKQQHKQAAKLLRAFYATGEKKWFAKYRDLESYLTLLPIDSSFPSVADRYHFHLKKASVSLKEHDFLVKRFDSLTDTPYLSVALYLENLRSGHNVGSILRTVEAFRLGTVYFSQQTPGPTNKKVSDAAMGTALYLPHVINASIEDLPDPLVAVETVETAPPYFNFSFPKRFSLLLGNEEYGLKSETIKRADHIVQIPLFGGKNSLNVACAFAIVAAEICRQQRGI